MPRTQALKSQLVVKRSVMAAMPAAFQAEAISIMDAAARAGETRAKQEAPVRTGFMRNNIVVESPTQLSRLLRSKANYSGYVNYGTRYMAARPFFTNGAAEMERVYMDGWDGLEMRLPRL